MKDLMTVERLRQDLEKIKKELANIENKLKAIDRAMGGGRPYDPYERDHFKRIEESLRGRSVLISRCIDSIEWRLSEEDRKSERKKQRRRSDVQAGLRNSSELEWLRKSREERELRNNPPKPQSETRKFPSKKINEIVARLSQPGDLSKRGI